ncbi:MAG: YlxR family protein [Pleurocapsa sp.]
MNQINYRRCVSCRRAAPKKSFWRVVRLASSHKIQLDRGMGRSAYLCPNLKCLTQARIKNRLRGSLRTTVSDDIYQSLQERLS